MSDRCPECGREWPVDSLRQQCQAGDHREAHLEDDDASNPPDPV